MENQKLRDLEMIKEEVMKRKCLSRKVKNLILQLVEKEQKRLTRTSRIDNIRERPPGC